MPENALSTKGILYRTAKKTKTPLRDKTDFFWLPSRTNWFWVFSRARARGIFKDLKDLKDLGGLSSPVFARASEGCFGQKPVLLRTETRTFTDRNPYFYGQKPVSIVIWCAFLWTTPRKASIANNLAALLRTETRTFTDRNPYLQ